MINDADFQKAVELIGKSNKVLITTHTRPDGDGCGCIAAISETLTTLGKNPKILLLSELPAQYEFLFATNSIKSVKSVAKLDPDLIIIVDTSSYNQLPELIPLLSSLVPRNRPSRNQPRLPNGPPSRGFRRTGLSVGQGQPRRCQAD